MEPKNPVSIVWSGTFECPRQIRVVPALVVEEVAVAVAAVAEAVEVEAVGAASKLLSKRLSKPLNLELQGLKHHPLVRSSGAAEVAEADSAVETADLAFRPAS